jgi:hypothetical protein
MTLVKRLWLTVAFTLACLIVVMLLSSQQLFSLRHQFTDYRERQQLSTHLQTLKAEVLSLPRRPAAGRHRAAAGAGAANVGKLIPAISQALPPASRQRSPAQGAGLLAGLPEPALGADHRRNRAGRRAVDPGARLQPQHRAAGQPDRQHAG